MSADHPSLQTRDGRPASATEGASTGVDIGIDPDPDPDPDSDANRPTNRSGHSSGRTEPTTDANAASLATRLERCRLRVRVAALEQALADSERRRRSQIEQYERILQERDATNTDEPTPDGFVARVWRAVADRGP